MNNCIINKILNNILVFASVAFLSLTKLPPSQPEEVFKKIKKVHDIRGIIIGEIYLLLIFDFEEN